MINNRCVFQILLNSVSFIFVPWIMIPFVKLSSLEESVCSCIVFHKWEGQLVQFKSSRFFLTFFLLAMSTDRGILASLTVIVGLCFS